MTDPRVTQPLSNRPILLVDHDALLPEIFQCADQRFRTAHHLLASLEGADQCDVRKVSQAALLLIEDGCRVMEAIEGRLSELP